MKFFLQHYFSAGSESDGVPAGGLQRF